MSGNGSDRSSFWPSTSPRLGSPGSLPQAIASIQGLNWLKLIRSVAALIPDHRASSAVTGMSVRRSDTGTGSSRSCWRSVTRMETLASPPTATSPSVVSSTTWAASEYEPGARLVVLHGRVSFGPGSISSGTRLRTNSGPSQVQTIAWVPVKDSSSSTEIRTSRPCSTTFGMACMVVISLAMSSSSLRGSHRGLELSTPMDRSTRNAGWPCGGSRGGDGDPRRAGPGPSGGPGADLRDVERALQRPVRDEVSEQTVLPLGAQPPLRPGPPQHGEHERRRSRPHQLRLDGPAVVGFDQSLGGPVRHPDGVPERHPAQRRRAVSQQERHEGAHCRLELRDDLLALLVQARRGIEAPPGRGQLRPLPVGPLGIERVPEGAAQQDPDPGERVRIVDVHAEHERSGKADDPEQAECRGDAHLPERPRVRDDLRD